MVTDVFWHHMIYTEIENLNNKIEVCLAYLYFVISHFFVNTNCYCCN